MGVEGHTEQNHTTTKSTSLTLSKNVKIELDWPKMYITSYRLITSKREKNTNDRREKKLVTQYAQ